MRHTAKRIINYDKDLPFEEFAELVAYDVDIPAKVFFKKLWRIPKLSEQIDFDTASLLMCDIDMANHCWPLITRTILKRWTLRSPKTLKQISVWDKIALDAYPFDYHNRTLECVSKMCNDNILSGWDFCCFKVLQMKAPEIIFIIKDEYSCMELYYYRWCYHLDEPVEHLRLLDNRKLDDDFLKELNEKMEEGDKYNELINKIINWCENL